MTDEFTLPGQTSPDDAPDTAPTVVGLTGDDADAVMAALSSSTARELLDHLADAPAHAPALAEATGTSTQNVHYHLDRLESAGAVEVVDTVYSTKGQEMAVYAPAADPVVLFAGDDDERETLVAALTELLGAVALLALASVGVQAVVERVLYPGGPTPVPGATGAYALPPVTNVAPPVGLVAFVVGVAIAAGAAYWRHR